MSAPDPTARRRTGSSRAALYRLTGLPLVFTLECNYNRCNAANELQRKQHGSEIDAGLCETTNDAHFDFVSVNVSDSGFTDTRGE